MKPFVALDGEAIERKYFLLADSNGRQLLNRNGLMSSEIFNFLFDVDTKNNIFVVFGLTYDVNNWLKDVPLHRLKLLQKYNQTVFWCGGKKYLLRFIPSKMFKLIELWPNRKGRKCRMITIFDCWSFFQSNFQKACLNNLPKEELKELKTIIKYKALRNEFKWEDEERIIEYNRIELNLLKRLMEKLRNDIESCGYKLKSWHGSAALGKSMLEKEKIKRHLQVPKNEVFYDILKRAYAGGRVELCQIGFLQSKFYGYDINSAYPSALISLPSLSGGVWEKISSKKQPFSSFALARVSYRFAPDKNFYPLFFRMHTGAILYPQAGQGWYWWDEIEAAKEWMALSEGKHEFKIHEIIEFKPGNDIKPFQFVSKLYDKRLEFKAAKNANERVLKTGLNSLYGVFAQQAGGREEKLPKFFQMEYAGFVTAATRARLIRASLPIKESVICFSTDAYLAKEPSPFIKISKKLGEWSEAEQDGIGLICVQPGIFWKFIKHGSRKRAILRTRGFAVKELKRYERVLSCWKRHGRNPDFLELRIPITVRRFVSLGSAFASEEILPQWRQWREFKKKLDISGRSEKRWGLRPGEVWEPWNRMVKLKVNENYEKGMLSHPYKLAWEETESGRLFEDGVDSFIVDEEFEAGYL